MAKQPADAAADAIDAGAPWPTCPCTQCDAGADAVVEMNFSVSTSPRGRRPPRLLWEARRRRIVPGLYVSVLGFLSRRIERGGTAARGSSALDAAQKKAPNSPQDSKVRRTVLYLSTLSVPPAFSIAGATREALSI